ERDVLLWLNGEYLYIVYALEDHFPAQSLAAAAAAAIDRDDRAGRIARAVGGEKGGHPADLLGLGGAAKGVSLHQLLPFLGIAELCLRAMPGQGDQPLGHDRAGIDADDAQPVARRGAAYRPRESHQRRVAGGPRDVVEIGVLAGSAEDVDDDALFARGHQRVKAPRHV